MTEVHSGAPIAPGDFPNVPQHWVKWSSYGSARVMGGIRVIVSFGVFIVNIAIQWALHHELRGNEFFFCQNGLPIC